MSTETVQIQQLVGGVSQQPAVARLPGQFDECINRRLKFAIGNCRRNPLEFRGFLSGAPTTNTKVHTIVRDESERYKVFLTDGGLKVYDFNTLAEKTVAFPDGTTYLETSDPANDLRVITVGDYTFILNRSKTPAMQSDTTGGAIAGSRQTFEDLDDTAVNNSIWLIAGDPMTTFDNYFVKRVSGSWTETVKPGVQFRIDPTTMPHLLVRLGDGTFSFEAAEWGDRIVGDEDSNQNPSFIGKPIEDIFLFRGRLGLLAGPNVILSAIADPFMFFRSTVVAGVDSDPIDTATTDTSVNTLQFASVFQKALIVSSRQRQFQLTSNGPLTGSSISIDPVTSIRLSGSCRPLAQDSELYLLSTSPETQYGTLHELYVEQQTVATATADVTLHVPEFLPNDISKMVGDTTQDIMFAISPSNPRVIFVHEFIWFGDEKKQMAWHRWELPSWVTVLDIEIVDGALEVTLADSVNGTTQHRLSLDIDVKPPQASCQLFLDFRTQRLTGSYNSGTNRTTFQLPYDVSGNQSSVRVSLPSGRLIDPALQTFPATDQVSVPGNVQYAYVGFPFTDRFRLSQQFLPMRDGELAFSGRLVMKNLVLYFAETAFFKVTVTARGRDPITTAVTPATAAQFTGKTLGSDYFVLGDPSFQTGEARFLVAADSRDVTIDIINDSHLASTFLMAEWTAEFFTRARIR